MSQNNNKKIKMNPFDDNVESTSLNSTLSPSASEKRAVSKNLVVGSTRSDRAVAPEEMYSKMGGVAKSSGKIINYYYTNIKN